jgi:hypothetical protein
MGRSNFADRSAALITQGVMQPAAKLAAGSDPAITRRFLELLRFPPAGCTEFRVLRAAVDRQGQIHAAETFGNHLHGSTMAGWYDDIDRLTAQARRLRGISGYVTINPVEEALLARSENRLTRVKHTTRDVDIVCLRWLYLDIDPVRPPDISGTDAELAAAISRRDAILGEHPELAASALWGCSGNGGWILIRLPDYPNDPPHRALIVEAVKRISQKYSDSRVVIDTATVNPARLISLPGTIKAKGSPRPDRPWRPVTFDGIGPQAVIPRRASHGSLKSAL